MIHIIYELYIFFKIKTFSILSLAGHIPGANLMVKFNQFLSIKRSLALLEHFFSLFLKDNFVNLIFYFIFLLILILSHTHIDLSDSSLSLYIGLRKTKKNLYKIFVQS